MKAHSIGVDMHATDGSGSETPTPKKKRKRAQPDTVEKSEESNNNFTINTEGQILENNTDDSPEESAYPEAKEFGRNMKVDDFDGFTDEEATMPEPKKLFVKQEPS